MKVERIQLRQFRNYRQLDVSFADGINVLVGKNGAGKTNLVEAIDYLSLARSFRTTHDALLIEKGQPFASIQAWIQEDQVKRELGIVITPEGKQISLNHKPLTKVSELTEYMNVILFEPRDVMLFDDSPKVRRQFLDITLAKHSKAYLELITLYEKLLKQRNHLLKLNKIDHAHLAVITDGIPSQDMMRVKRYLRRYPKEKRTTIVGPNCAGIISAGKAMLGIMPGHIYLRGNVGIVSRSGTLGYEAAAQMQALGIGVTTSVGIGGDPINGSSFLDHMARFEQDPETAAVVMIGEIGGPQEAEAARWIKEHMSKPVVGYVAGLTAPKGRRMGHAGAIISGEGDTAAEKAEIMAANGLFVSPSASELGATVKRALASIGK